MNLEIHPVGRKRPSLNGKFTHIYEQNPFSRVVSDNKSHSVSDPTNVHHRSVQKGVQRMTLYYETSTAPKWAVKSLGATHLSASGLLSAISGTRKDATSNTLRPRQQTAHWSRVHFKLHERQANILQQHANAHVASPPPPHTKPASITLKGSRRYFFGWVFFCFVLK